jgi:DNA-directed RNA polymerase subunit RPC12/RpoP
MPQHNLRVIPKPDEKTAAVMILIDSSKTSLFKGVGNHTYICGQCAAVYLEDIEENQVTNMVLLCNGCGSYNATPQDQSIL